MAKEGLKKKRDGNDLILFYYNSQLQSAAMSKYFKYEIFDVMGVFVSWY